MNASNEHIGQSLPDAKGHFGPYGGKFVAETLMAPLAELEAAYRACLWSRLANRILWPLASFPAATIEQLYAGVRGVEWSRYLDTDTVIAVDFASSRSAITHTLFGAQKVKDSVVDHFMDLSGKRPSVDLSNPDLRINLYLDRDQATLSLDLSGDSLHRRGYRLEGGKAPLKEEIIHFVNKKMPGGLPKKTARALLDIEDKDYVPIIRNPKATTADTEAVFYFPGCGSERLFSQVGLATQAMLWHAGVQTVMPPGYLCCGYPQRGAGLFDKAEKMITDNRVLFHRVANTLNYLDIKTVVVSCGTCYDQLQGYQFDKIFPGCRIIDIHEFLLEKGITLPHQGGYLYHDPCHSPMKLQDPMKTVKALLGDGVIKSDRCCGEAGTLAVSRPDVSTQIRFRKEEEIRKGESALREQGLIGAKDNVKILTSCPACLQGLSRYGEDAQNGLLEADYIVIEMAKQILGENWMREYVDRANNGGIERVLL